MNKDYRELLIKYIQHIDRMEGETYTSPNDRDERLFSLEEWQEIEALSGISLRRNQRMWNNDE